MRLRLIGVADLARLRRREVPALLSSVVEQPTSTLSLIRRYADNLHPNLRFEAIFRLKLKFYLSTLTPT
jgi:hypothetical protein